MEKQRAPYLKNLKRESDVGKFINRRNERSNPVEKAVFTAAELEHLILGIKEEKKKVELLESLLKKIREDLIMRSFNDNGTNVVDLSASIWDQINSVINTQDT